MENISKMMVDKFNEYSSGKLKGMEGALAKSEFTRELSEYDDETNEGPGFEDVKMRGNNPRGSGRSYKKTQIPGGQFVEVKSKCKKFPYCNQGIGALKLYGGKKLNEAIKNVSKKMNISEDKIREIIAYEYRNLFSK